MRYKKDSIFNAMMKANGWTRAYEDTDGHPEEEDDAEYWSDEGPNFSQEMEEESNEIIPDPDLDKGNLSDSDKNTDEEVFQVDCSGLKSPKKKKTVSVSEAQKLELYEFNWRKINGKIWDDVWIHGDINCECVLMKSHHMVLEIPDETYLK